MAGDLRRLTDSHLFRPARAGREQVAPPRPVAGWAGVLALRAAALLPFRLLYRMAGAIGWAGAWFPWRPVRFARVTIRTCFPGLSGARETRLLRRCMAEGARAFCELGALWTWKRDRVLGLIREVRGEDHVKSALAHGRGVILAGPHLGAWELVGLYCSSRFPFTALYKRRNVTALDRFYEQGRSRFGATLAPGSPGGLRSLLRTLADGGVVGIMPDQDPRRGAGVFVPFFGTPANTTTLVSKLVQHTGARVVFAFAERLPAGAGFRLHFRQAPRAVYEADLVTSATALNLAIEHLVRDCPEQYLWSYKRFSVRPPGETNPYRVRAHA